MMNYKFQVHHRRPSSKAIMSNHSFVRQTISAATATTAANAGILQPHLLPWQRIDWPPGTQSRIFKDWGQFYAHRLLHKKALEYFGYSLEVCKAAMQIQEERQEHREQQQHKQQQQNQFFPPEYNTLNGVSQCKQYLARPEEAILDSKEAERLMAGRGFTNLKVINGKCDALFMSNQFEENLVVLHADERKFQGQMIKKCLQLHRQRVLSVLEDSIGAPLNHFMLDNWPFMSQLARQRPASVSFMPRPLWQQLQQNATCDVESIKDKPKVQISPLERARRRAADNLYNHHYMGISAIDVQLLHQLRTDRNLLNPFRPSATSALSEFLSDNFSIVRKFMKMMHCRKPIYHGGAQKKRNREQHLYRVEYQTKRDCFRILRQVRQLRRDGSFERLQSYVDHAMSNTIEMKTQRTLPWKWEFIQEIYNILALALIDRCTVPKNIDVLDLKNQCLLYRLPIDRQKEITHQFGGQNMYSDIDRIEERNGRIALKLEHLEERLLHSRYAIERTYLLYEIGRWHLKAMHHAMALKVARKAVHEAHSCNSIIWRFNSTFLVCQAHAMLNRFERLKDSLAKAKNLAIKLNAPKLIAYLDLCSLVNDYQLELQRKRRGSYTKVPGSPIKQMQLQLEQQQQQLQLQLQLEQQQQQQQEQLQLEQPQQQEQLQLE